MDSESNSERYIYNPIVKLLSRGRHHIREADVVVILSALASINDPNFTLRDLDVYIPANMKNDRRRRRSISTLLDTLAEIGFLEKPSERKWQKRTPTLSEFLLAKILELYEGERSMGHRVPRKTDETILKLEKQRR
ncbi:MAG: hypothetical protein NZ920_02855 [Aigarchaeota archaeon]|nr:hypothetical protein [Aigarchaeota archaeon]MDW8092438.1 hypothetical protein [Nitrososphaerota archaeon]